MTNPKRYDMENVSRGWDPVYEMVEGPDGDYVRYDDIKHLLDQDGRQTPAPSGHVGLGTAGGASSLHQPSSEPLQQRWVERSPEESDRMLAAALKVGASRDASPLAGCGNWKPKHGVGPYCGNCGFHADEHCRSRT